MLDDIHKMQPVALTLADGSLCELYIVLDPTGSPEIEEVTDEIVEREIAKMPYDVVSWRLVDEFPADRTYRDAWKDDGDKIDHDINKARELHKNMIRAIAFENQVPKKIADDPRIEEAMTVEELKALTLDELTK